MVDPRERQILLGSIVGLYGVEGWVKLESWTDPRTQLFKYQPWRLKGAQGERQIEGAQGRAQGKGIVAKLPGVDDRDQAAALIGSEIWVARSALPRPKPGEYYWSDLEGMRVVTLNGVELGKVSHVFATGANDVLAVRDGEHERLIPFVQGQAIQKIDLDQGLIEVDWDPDF